MLKRNGTLTVVGALEPLAPVNNQAMASTTTAWPVRLSPVSQRQELLDFCAEHAIGPDIQVIDVAEVSDAYHKVKKAACASGM